MKAIASSMKNLTKSITLILTLLAPATGSASESLPFTVVDLDGDGVKIIPLEKSEIYFDVDGDGLAERTAWITPDDAFLLTFTRQDVNIEKASNRMFAFFTGAFNKFEKADLDGDGYYSKHDSGNVKSFQEMSVLTKIWRPDGNENFPDPEEIIYELENEEAMFVISTKEQYLETDGKRFNLQEVQFEYEDTNVVWTSSCEKLTYRGARFNLDSEAQLECLENGYIPDEPWSKPVWEEYQKLGDKN